MRDFTYQVDFVDAHDNIVITASLVAEDDHDAAFRADDLLQEIVSAVDFYVKFEEAVEEV